MFTSSNTTALPCLTANVSQPHRILVRQRLATDLRHQGATKTRNKLTNRLTANCSQKTVPVTVETIERPKLTFTLPQQGDAEWKFDKRIQPATIHAPCTTAAVGGVLPSRLVGRPCGREQKDWILSYFGFVFFLGIDHRRTPSLFRIFFLIASIFKTQKKLTKIGKAWPM